MKRKIKVAFFSHDANLKGGGSLSLLNLIKEISKSDVECFVFLPAEGEFAVALRKNNVPFKVIPNFFWISGYDEKASLLREKARLLKKTIKRIIFMLRYFPKYIKAIKNWRADVLYTNTTAIFEGAIISMLLKKPHIWHVRELKDIHFKYDYGNRFFRFFLKKAKAQIFVSNALKKALSSYYVSSKAYVVYNGIPEFNINTNYNKYTDLYVFSMVGRLKPSKNMAAAIEALSYVRDKYPHTLLLIAGGGDPNYVAFLKELVIRFKVEDHVKFLGEVSNPYMVYAQSNAYVMCSTNETFGRVTVEAMLAKLPVIGYKSEITGTKEIVEDEVTGLLYEGGAKELAMCMERFMSNPTWAEGLGLKGYKRAIERFSPETYAKNIYHIIEEQVKPA